MKLKKEIIVWLVILVITFIALPISYSAVCKGKVYLGAVSPDTLTVTAQYSGAKKIADSIIAVYSDTGGIGEIIVSGFAKLNPGSKLYVGIGNTYANHDTSLLVLDTIVYPGKLRGSVTLPFSIRYFDNTLTAVTDTFYVNFAIGGSTPSEYVFLSSLKTRMIILPRTP